MAHRANDRHDSDFAYVNVALRHHPYLKDKPLPQYLPALALAQRPSTGDITAAVAATATAAATAKAAATASDVGGSGEEPNNNLIFFYGTLKTGFQWNQKYLSFATKICDAVTEDPLPFVIGACGVPYVLDNAVLNAPGTEQNHHVVGEIWCVDRETMQALDEYEGVSKGYYQRRRVKVIAKSKTAGITSAGDSVDGHEILSVWMYTKINSTDDLRHLPRVAEYTFEAHTELYRPIRHIAIKQQGYLGQRLTADEH